MKSYRYALFAALLSPAAAPAGPIGWGYSAAVTYSQDYGPRFAVTLAPGGEVTATPGEPEYVGLFTSTGTARPDPGSYRTEYGFDITVTLTDLASGRSAPLTFAGGYSPEWSYPPGTDPSQWRWDSEYSSFGDFWDWRAVELGANRYRVRAYGGGSGQFPFGELEVAAYPLPTAATPEPGTLGLFAVGLVGVGLRRLRPALRRG